MYYSVSFYNGTSKRNTYDDWHLVPEARPIIASPEVKTKYVEVPGAHGSLDLTDSLTGGPLYQNREGEIRFYILNGYDTFVNIKTAILQYLQGKKIKMITEDDPGYYYEGRLSASFENGSENNHASVTLKYTFAPFKRSCTVNGATITDTGGISL